MTPKRIQRKRAKGWRKPPNSIYVGRPTMWGNPYRTLDGYEDFLKQQIKQYGDLYLKVLKGKDLMCWCPLDKPCHADILLELANK